MRASGTPDAFVHRSSISLPSPASPSASQRTTDRTSPVIVSQPMTLHSSETTLITPNDSSLDDGLGRSIRSENNRSSMHSTDSSSDNDDDDDDESLPDFWELVKLPDGDVLYVDHRTETTTWERPRRQRSRRPQLSSNDASARLVASSSTILRSTRSSNSVRAGDNSIETLDIGSTARSSTPTFITDLLRDGYSISADGSHSSWLDAQVLPDFWEVRKDGGGDYVYYIDHPAGIIIKKPC